MMRRLAAIAVMAGSLFSVGTGGAATSVAVGGWNLSDPGYPVYR